MSSFQNVRLGHPYPKMQLKPDLDQFLTGFDDVFRFSLKATLAADDGFKRPRVG